MTTVLHFLSQQELLLLLLLVGLGSLLGHLRIGGTALGAAAVLFLALGLGALGHAQGYRLAVPETFGALGLMLFTFSVGVISGAGFFASLRSGLAPVLAMVAVMAAAAGIAVGLGQVLGLDAATVAGSYAGALTNTPALAAAREAAHSGAPTVGYAVTYLFGVVGMLLACALALRHRADDTDVPEPLVNCTVRVETTSAPGIRDIEARHGGRIRFTRLHRNGSGPLVQTAVDDDVLQRNDLVTLVGLADEVEQVTRELGHHSSHALDADRRRLDFRRITLSNPRLAGRTVAQLDLTGRFGATVSRVRRGDVDMLAIDSLPLQLGDRLRVVVPQDRMAEVTAFLGDSVRGLSDINPIGLGLGMALGVLLGKAVFPLPGGLSFSIGSAAGTLVLGLVLGRLGRIGSIVTTMPHVAAQALAELGLLMFLAQAGTRAGEQIGDAFASGTWLRIFVHGLVVTSVVAVGLYVVMRRGFRMGSTRLSGLLGGAQTQPAVLAFANGRTGYDSRVAQGYALVYPAAMVTKILLGQILGGLVGAG